VATASVPLPPVAAMVTEPGVTVYEHAAAAWFTVKVFPAMVTVTERVVVAVFAAALNPVDPEPLPLAPLVTVTHDPPLTEVQPQPAVVVTATEPVPPAAGTDWLVGRDRERAGDGAALRHGEGRTRDGERAGARRGYRYWPRW